MWQGSRHNLRFYHLHHAQGRSDSCPLQPEKPTQRSTTVLDLHCTWALCRGGPLLHGPASTCVMVEHECRRCRADDHSCSLGVEHLSICVTGSSVVARAVVAALVSVEMHYKSIEASPVLSHGEMRHSYALKAVGVATCSLQDRVTSTYAVHRSRDHNCSHDACWRHRSIAWKRTLLPNKLIS